MIKQDYAPKLHEYSQRMMATKLEGNAARLQIARMRLEQIRRDRNE